MTSSLQERVRRALRAVPDYPKPGVLFQDITPVLRDGALFRSATDAMAEPFAGKGVSLVMGIEARGFILGAAVASALGAGFIPLRKPGKLPWLSLREGYDLEYGEDALEAHVDACESGETVLIVDDVLATGGTARAAGMLTQRLGGSLAGYSFLLEIEALGGRIRLPDADLRVLASV
jgi:adenine phosphoribosyltransferase